ncbi:MAG: hypothetical protein JHD16_01250 [Solirubrobacteraceae bacterium]|nr:hypothetical protein [Solirubrobacteraceae bacterium]
MADFEAIRAELAGHPHVRVEPLGGMPPERYRITYLLKSLRIEGDQPFVAEEHIVDLQLPLGYPREQPIAVPKSDVFHPNVDPTKYCIADYWSAGQPLTDIIVKMGEMLQFRVYNVGSPLNAVAARWVAEHEELLPIGDVDLGTADFDIELRPASAAATGEAPSAATESTTTVPLADDEDFAITLRREPSA